MSNVATQTFTTDEEELIFLNLRNNLEMLKEFVVDGEYSYHEHKHNARQKSFEKDFLIERKKLGLDRGRKYVLTDKAKKLLGLI